MCSYLAIDPYPRKPDAVFEPQVEPANPEDHPFAALKALRSDSDAPAAGKVPGKSKGKSKGSKSKPESVKLIPHPDRLAAQAPE